MQSACPPPAAEVDALRCDCRTLLLHGVLVSNAALEVLLPYASEEQKQRFVPAMAKGTSLGAFALTEPDSGSDIAGMSSIAERVGDEWVISGSKTFISNAADADVIVLFAKTAPGAGFRGISAFIVGKDTPGISVSAPQDKCGIRSATTYTIFLDEVHVGDDLVIGQLGSGGKMALSALNRARIDIAAMANGIAMRALQLAEEFGTARVQFGTKIRDFQAIQLMLGEMDAQLEVARLTAWWAATRRTRGPTFAGPVPSPNGWPPRTASPWSTRPSRSTAGRGS